MLILPIQKSLQAVYSLYSYIHFIWQTKFDLFGLSDQLTHLLTLSREEIRIGKRERERKSKNK